MVHYFYGDNASLKMFLKKLNSQKLEYFLVLYMKDAYERKRRKSTCVLKIDNK